MGGRQGGTQGGSELVLVAGCKVWLMKAVSVVAVAELPFPCMSDDL